MTVAERSIRVCNEAGLHARPCHAIVSLALEFESQLRIAHGGNEVNGKSILELMTLNAPMGSLLVVRADGGDATRLLDRVAALFAAGFDETY
jgi:phosphotransferase system HPr (HPr) family protein